jgi:hypothetical protein
MGLLITPGLLAFGCVIAVTVLAFTRCAVAELVVRLAVRLYAPAGSKGDVQRELWIDAIQQLKPKERPSHAGMFLWAGVANFGRERRQSTLAMVLGAYAEMIANSDRAEMYHRRALA